MKIIELPFKLRRPILACGADLKGAFALAKGGTAHLFDGFGDLADLDNFAKYESAIKRHIRELGIKPRIIAHDMHPGYSSTRFARIGTLQITNYTLHAIQHHEAHIASAIVDNGIKGPVIGATFDGTGYGSDGNIWGGEFFVGGLNGFNRAAHLEYIPMPGADMAVKEPYRMAVSYLYRVYGKDFLKLKIGLVKKIDRKNIAVLIDMMDKKINSPLTSSMGRLFDAVTAIVLSKEKSAFEAELPIELESIAEESCDGLYDFVIKYNKDAPVIGTSRVIKGVVHDMLRKIDKSIISAKFHNTVADMISRTASSLRKRSGINKIVLTGGVFQNRYLVNRAKSMLDRSGFKIYTHSNIPANDSGIPIGQIALAGARAGCV